MTTPNGTRTEAKQLPYRDASSDAAVQAGAGEATVRGTDQDVTISAQADVASGLSKLKGGIANDQGQPFTGSL